jgi:hypothetical protein
MPILVPDIGERELLADLLDNGEDWTLKLFRTDVTPAESDTDASFTVANFTDYVDKTLTRAVGAGNWGTPSTNTGTTSSTYNSGTPQSWTCGASGNTIYGAYVVGATSGNLQFSDKFAAARTLTDGDTLEYTPIIELA